jgi:hypothetical protein
LRNIEWRDLDGNSVATGTESQTLKKKNEWNLQQPRICVESPQQSIGSRVKSNRWDDAVQVAALPTWLYWWLCPSLDKSSKETKQKKKI